MGIRRRGSAARKRIFFMVKMVELVTGVLVLEATQLFEGIASKAL